MRKKLITITILGQRRMKKVNNDYDLKPTKESKRKKTSNIYSKIITLKQAELISKWIKRTSKLTSSFKFKLILRGSRDGFTADKFHKVCDNKSRTLTIIKVKGSNEILGGI